jgi:serine/threonine protein phosphatase 1
MAGNDNEIFAVLKQAARVWAVAAIHGEAERLRALHGELWGRFQRGDRLVYLGNYLGHGPDVPGTLDELLSFRRAVLARPGLEPEDIVFLRGAQEEMWQKLLQIQFAVDPDAVLDWMLEQGLGATLAAYGGTPETARQRFRGGALAVTRWTGEVRANLQRHPGHDDLLGALKRAAYTAERGLLFVHAGIDPKRPLAEQGDTLWWGSGYFSAIDEPFAGFKLVVRGYDRGRGGAQFGAHAATIDAGCGFGGPLLAACFAADGDLVERLEA